MVLGDIYFLWWHFQRYSLAYFVGSSSFVVNLGILSSFSFLSGWTNSIYSLIFYMVLWCYWKDGKTGSFSCNNCFCVSHIFRGGNTFDDKLANLWFSTHNLPWFYFIIFFSRKIAITLHYLKYVQYNLIYLLRPGN